MSLPFSPEGKRKWSITAIAHKLNCEELEVIDAIRFERPGLLKKGVTHRFRELEAYEFRKYILFKRKMRKIA